jgi:mannosyltransferase OCH1-like enzyme
VIRHLRTYNARANALRLSVVHEFGGVYADVDVECLRPFDAILSSCDAFAGFENETTLGNAVFGAAVRHPWVEWQVARLTDYVGKADPWGPSLMTSAAAAVEGVRRFEQAAFYPIRWDQVHEGRSAHPDSYAVHYWAKQWVEVESPEPGRRQT